MTIKGRRTSLPFDWRAFVGGFILGGGAHFMLRAFQ
jgi:hypothetical protein